MKEGFKPQLKMSGMTAPSCSFECQEVNQYIIHLLIKKRERQEDLSMPPQTGPLRQKMLKYTQIECRLIVF